MAAPVQQPKVNFHRLLRQVQTQKEQEDFFIKNGLLPKNIECPKFKDNLTQVYPLTNPAANKGWREPGNKTLQRSRIFGLVLFMRGVTDQEGRPAWQRQSGAGAGRDSWSCSE